MEQEGGDESTLSSEGKERAKGTRQLPEIVLLGVALVIGNQAHYSKFALDLGTMEFIVPSFVCWTGFFCLTLCLAETTSTLPFSGGLYGITRVTLGPYIGFLVACCEMLQSVAFTSTLLYPIGMAGVAIFGLADNWAPLFWIIMLALSLTINILGLKYFWRVNNVVVITAILLFVVYYAVSMPRIDCSRYGGGILQGRSVLRDWPSNLPTGTIMFAGLELLPMACGDAVQPRKTIPRSFLWAFAIITVNVFLLIPTASCSDPGGFMVAISPESTIFHGFVRGLHATQQVGNALTIPILFATSCAFTYVYGIQLRSMADSGLFPTVLHYSYGEDRIPYVALLFGAVLVLVHLSLSHFFDAMFFYTLFATGHHAASFIEVVFLLSFVQLRWRLSSLRREFTQPLGVWAAFYCIGIIILCVVSLYVFVGDDPSSIYWFVGYLGFVTFWYFWQVRSSQKFSPQEQEIMFQAYVINANSATRNRRRLAKSAFSQAARGISSTPSRKKSRESNSSGGTLLTRLNHLIASPPSSLDPQKSTFSLYVSTSKMLLRRHSQVGASNTNLNELNERETTRTEEGRGGDETNFFQPDNTISSVLVTQDPRPSLLSISSELMQTIVKNRPEHRPERYYIDISPRHYNIVLPADDSSSIVSPKVLDEGAEIRSYRSHKDSSFALIHPSHDKSRSLDNQDNDESGRRMKMDGCCESYGYEGRIKPECDLLHPIRRQLSKCIGRSRNLFHNKAFDEKVEELLLKKSLSLNSSLESDADDNDEEGEYDRGLGDESRSLLSSRDHDS